MDEALNGVAWALATNPEQGLRIPNSNLWLIKTIGHEIEGHYIAPLYIWYSIPDRTKVELLAITKAPLSEYEEEEVDDDEPPF